MLPRKTVASVVMVEGKGLHSGLPVSVRVHPATSGVRFLHEGAVLGATPENVTETRRCTRLGTVSTVEHLLSALAGLGITDADVEVTGAELPGLDGSSLGFVQAIQLAGTTECGHLEVDGPFARVFSVEGETKVSIGLGDGVWRYDFDLEAMDLGWQHAQVALTTSSYVSEVAPARTTVFEHELPALLQMGLGQGLQDNGVVVIRRGGYANEVRFPDEPARHKLLDLIGDLSLSGVPCAMLRVVAVRSGHMGNVAAAAKLKSHVKIVRSS